MFSFIYKFYRSRWGFQGENTRCNTECQSKSKSVFKYNYKDFSSWHIIQSMTSVNVGTDPTKPYNKTSRLPHCSSRRNFVFHVMSWDVKQWKWQSEGSFDKKAKRKTSGFGCGLRLKLSVLSLKTIRHMFDSIQALFMEKPIINSQHFREHIGPAIDLSNDMIMWSCSSKKTEVYSRKKKLIEANIERNSAWQFVINQKNCH